MEKLNEPPRQIQLDPQLFGPADRPGLLGARCGGSRAASSAAGIIKEPQHRTGEGARRRARTARKSLLEALAGTPRLFREDRARSRRLLPLVSAADAGGVSRAIGRPQSAG